MLLYCQNWPPLKFLTGIEFLCTIAFNFIRDRKFENSNVVSFMKSILDNFYNFQQASSQFTNALHNLPFIETSSNSKLVAPCTLYDPENELLKELFYNDQDKFPGSEFHPYLDILRKCGLQSSVSATDILQIVTAIRKQNIGNGVIVVKGDTYWRASAVLKYIKVHPHLLLENYIMRMVNWNS